MTTAQAKSIVKQLAGLYRGITQADAKFVTRQIKDLPHPLVVKAMDDYRKTHEAFDAAEFAKACEQAVKPPAPCRPAASFCDIYRRQDERLKDAGDVEVILRVHWGWWIRCDGTPGYYTRIQERCRVELVKLGLPEQEIAALVPLVFLPREEFRREIEALRQSRAPAAAFG